MKTYEDIETIDTLKHCIGMYGKHKPYRRHGKLFYRPWRNRYNTNVDDPLWKWMVEMGYADSGKKYDHESIQTTFYWLTRKGLDWLGNKLGITIHDEEE